jgi:hypothetical protein
MLTKRFTLITLITLASLFQFSLQDCTCEEPPSPGEAYNDPNIALIFVGTPVDIRTMGDVGFARFDVDKVIKGDSVRSVVVRNNSSLTDCGYAFTKGVKHIVYAKRVGNDFITDVCTRTNLLTPAIEDRSEFNIATVNN